MKLGEVVVIQVSSKSDEKQKKFFNSLFFCSEFQSVNRIVKIGAADQEEKEEGAYLELFFMYQARPPNLPMSYV